MKSEDEHVSPTGEILHTDSFGLCIHVVLELDETVDISHAKKAIREILLSRGPRFSSVVVKALILFFTNYFRRLGKFLSVIHYYQFIIVIYSLCIQFTINN